MCLRVARLWNAYNAYRALGIPRLRSAWHALQLHVKISNWLREQRFRRRCEAARLQHRRLGR